jgi:hypothetical protein
MCQYGTGKEMEDCDEEIVQKWHQKEKSRQCPYEGDAGAGKIICFHFEVGTNEQESKGDGGPTRHEKGIFAIRKNQTKKKGKQGHQSKSTESTSHT